MKNKTTLYHFILDSSGSMSNDRERTVQLFNQQIATVRSLAHEYPEQTFLAGLTIFNDQVQHILRETAADKLIDLKFEVYHPDGLTALYDAIGESTRNIRDKFEHQIRENELSVVVIILTDGHENASKKYDARKIAGIIKELEASDNWSFTILGADFDITKVSADLNFSPQSSLNYEKANFRSMAMDMEDSIREYAELKKTGIISKDFFRKK